MLPGPRRRSPRRCRAAHAMPEVAGDVDFRGATGEHEGGDRPAPPLLERLVAPGPGRSATMFTVPLLVAGMQKTVASLAACGMPSVRLPAGEPVSCMHRVAGLPKAPA